MQNAFTVSARGAIITLGLITVACGSDGPSAADGGYADVGSDTPAASGEDAPSPEITEDAQDLPRPDATPDAVPPDAMTDVRPGTPGEGPLAGPWVPLHIGEANSANNDGGVTPSPAGVKVSAVGKSFILLHGNPGSRFGSAGRTDEIDFVYQKAEGDVEISTHLSTAGGCGYDVLRLGLMMRQSSEPMSPFIFAGLAGGTLFTSSYRALPGEASRTLGSNSTAVSRANIRLVRRGQNFESSFSIDGEYWQTWTRQMVWPTQSLLGLAMASSDKTPNCVAVFENTRVRRSPLPPPWLQSEIATEEVGEASFANDRFTIKAAGDDIIGGNDRFMYAYQPWIGDVQITAQVVDWNGAESEARAGVMVRTSLRSGGPSAFVGLDYKGRVESVFRDAYGSDSGVTRATGSAGTARWVRLERRGDTFHFFRSADGVDWTSFKTASFTAPVDRAFVGLAAVDDDTPAMATFANVTVTLPPELPDAGAPDSGL